jgi:hypothetical protein
MKNLTLKKQFENKILERKSNKSGATIKIDTSKLDSSKFKAYSDIGFADIFEEEKPTYDKVEPVVNATAKRKSKK